MFSGFYTVASGVLTQQRAINVMTNNLVNQKTPGYQTERLVTTTFDYEYVLRKDAYSRTRIGGASPIRLTEEVPVLMESGLMEETNRPLDFAIDGAGFFNIRPFADAQEGEDGQAAAGEEPAADQPTVFLTRNGNFSLDEEGYLVLNEVGRVLDSNGQDIQLGTSDFTVTSDGYIYDSEGDEVGQFLLTWPGIDAIDRYSNGLYAPKEAGNNPVLADARVAQGNLETSGVDVNQEMTQVMAANRNLQACTVAMKTIDDINQRSAASIAKIG